MSKKVKRILMIGIAVLIAFILGLVYYLNQRIIYNNYAVNGNTPGNLYNEGTFCESNGVVYFANPSDDHTLYSMSPDEGNLQKLSDDTVYYINADDHYLYYARNNNSDESSMSFLNVSRNSLCRMKLNGKQLEILDDQPCSYVTLLGNELYYLHYEKETATTLYHVGIDGKDMEQVREDAPYTCCAVGDTIYYAGVTSDHNIHSLTAGSSSSALVLEGNCWMPIVDDDYIYYMDCDANYRLTRVSRSNNSTEVLTDEGISYYNLYGNYIFYQTINETDPGLYLLDLSTGNSSLIAQGNHENISVTSSYVYFSEYGDDTTVYHTPYTGSFQIEVFDPGTRK